MFMSKYEWGDIFRRIDSSGQQDPVAKSDVEQWLSIVVCAKRNTIVRDYEIQEIHLPIDIRDLMERSYEVQEIHLPLTIVLVFSLKLKPQ